MEGPLPGAWETVRISAIWPMALIGLLYSKGDKNKYASSKLSFNEKAQGLASKASVPPPNGWQSWFKLLNLFELYFFFRKVGTEVSVACSVLPELHEYPGKY